MVSETRSACKSRDDLDGHDLKRMRKDSLVRSPGNTAKALAARQTTTPEKKVLPSTPAKRTSERVGKCTTPDSLRRSDRFKNDSSTSPFKESAEEPLSNLKKKREKTLAQVTMESKKTEVDLVDDMKREKMNGRKFKSLFKRQRIQEVMPDGGDELKKSEKLLDACSGKSSGVGLQSAEDTNDISDGCSKRVVGELRDESVHRSGLQDSTLKEGRADVENGIHVDACLRDYVSEEPCSNYSQNKSSTRDMSDNSEKLPKNCSSTCNTDASESSRDNSKSANCCEISVHHEVTEDTASAPLVCEYCTLDGTCPLCSKSRRVGYDSPEQELCSCSPMDEDLASCDHGAADDSGHPLSERHADSHMNGSDKLCSLCNKDGYLLSCEGKSCLRCYHLSCLDPPLTDALPGVWHCPQCVKKKLLFGVHSVSDGLESIWAVREVEVSNTGGVQQKQFLVKYRGLAHAHNQWVPEKQLLLENPRLVSNFLEKDQDVEWNTEWTVPHRLLWKRPIHDKICIASSSSVISMCEYEWLVKWRGLNYDHATWELDNACFLSSSLGQTLVQDYENRRGKAKQESNKFHMESIVEQPELLPSRLHANDNHILKNANKLRDFLLKCPNAVVVDDQEQARTAIFLIHSMIGTFRPFLIVTTHDSLSQWEADFEQLVPSVDVVLYSGDRDTRKKIRASEFFDEGGCLVVQVLLSSVEAVLEDLEILRSIKWKTIVIDEYQQPGIANGLPQIKTLLADMRIVLVSGQIKDAASEYLNILSFVEPHDNFNKLRNLKSETHDNLSKLKDRLSHFIAYGRSSQVSMFIEYWVPVQISNLQFEIYCATLHSSSNALSSCTSKDPVGILQDLLHNLRKCCHHPFLVDPDIQARFIADMHPADEVLDFGIKASGKLQLLDVMLTEIKTRGLKVLILFQLLGTESIQSKNILQDFIIQRFGLDAYEYVDAAYSPTDKQNAGNRFNAEETGQFVFLLEYRACSPVIKLSSLDVVILYDSDWNPANDLRALKKISVDSKVEKINIFRFYSPFTIEERALVLAKQNLNLDQKLQNFNRSTSNTLLSWGAAYLFSKVDEYLADRNSNSTLNFVSGQSLLDDVMKELRAILSGNFENSDSVISEAKLDVGSYKIKSPMFGESKVQLKDGEMPHVFWKNLFEGKNVMWNYLRRPSPRNRKRVQYWEGSHSNSELKKDNMAKRPKRMVNEKLGPISSQVDLVADEAAVSNGGPAAVDVCNQSENLHRDGQSSLAAEVSVSAASKERILSTDDQKSLHGVLQRGTKTLCRTLKLPENVIQAADSFLQYVIKNHHVNSNSKAVVQAFQISLCWVAASILKLKVDKKESLMLAKQHLDYECTEELARSAFSKMRDLKKMYLQSSENITCLNRDSLSAEEDFSSRLSNFNGEELLGSSYKEGSKELKFGEKSADEEHPERQILTQQKVALKDKGDACEIDDEIKKLQKKIDKRMKKLKQKHAEEIQELLRIWEDKKAELDSDHKLRQAVIRSIHGQTSIGMSKLKVQNDEFQEKIKEHDILRDVELKKLEAEHLTAIKEERQKAVDWLAQAKARSSERRVINGCQSHTSPLDDDAGGLQPRSGDKLPKSCQHLENENPGREIEAESYAAAELLNKSKNSNDHREAISTNLPAPQEHIPDEIQSVDPTKVDPVVPDAGQNQPGELSNPSKEESNNARKTTLSNDLLGQGGEAEVVAIRDLHGPGRPSLHLEQPIVMPDSCDLLPQKDSDALCVENGDAPEPSNFVSPITDNIVNPEPSDKAPVDLVSRSLHSLSVDVSHSCDLSPAIGYHGQGRSSPQTAEPEGNEEVLHESISRTEEHSELQPDRLNAGPATGVFDEQNVELPVSLPREVTTRERPKDVALSQEVAGMPKQPNQAVPENDVAISQEVVTTHEMPNQVSPRNDVVISQEVASTSQPNQAVPVNDVTVPQEVGSTPEQPNQSSPHVVNVGVDNLHGPPFFANPTYPPTWNSAPSLLPDPLQFELDRTYKEIEQMKKSHEDMMLQLKSDCDREIEEITSQIRKKYEVKFQETETQFRLKWNEHDKNQKKLRMNKMLADAFRSKCLETRSPGFAGPPGFVQPSVRPSPSPSIRPSPSQPAHSQLTAAPAVQTIPQLSQSPSVRPPMTIRNVTAHPIQGAQHAAAHVSAHSPRPLVIGSITPSSLRSSSNICSIAPHLQPSRPAAGAPVLPNASDPPPRAPQTPSHDSGSAESQAEPNPPVAAYQPRFKENRDTQVPDISSTFHSLEQSDLEMLGNVHSNQTSAVEPAVVCLSDDE